MGEAVTVLVCAFGSPWTSKGCGPCRQCLAHAATLNRAFWRDVFFGRFDRDGFTVAERKAQAKVLAQKE